jgi:hypothetical protein
LNTKALWWEKPLVTKNEQREGTRRLRDADRVR